MPEVELGSYHDIRKEYSPPAVEEEEIEKVIHNLQNAFATAEPVERAAEEGDLVFGILSAAFSEPEEGKDANFIRETPYQVVIGSTEPGQDDWPYEKFSKELIGMSADEEKVVHYTYPEDSPYDKLQGKSVDFTIKLQSVKAMQYPELDDEFAKTAGEFETFEDLKKAVVANLEEQHTNEYNDNYLSELIDSIIEQSVVKYPPITLEEEQEHLLHHLQQDLSKQKIDLDTYLKIRQTDREKFLEEEIKPAAKARLERSLVLDKLTDVEKIDVNREDLQSEMTQTLMQLQSDPEFKKYKTRQKMQELTNAVAYNTANRMMNERLMERLKAIASGTYQEEAQADETSAEETVAPPTEPEAEPETNSETGSEASATK
jgi:trigger factor